MRAARIRSHPPLPCILSDWQPSDQNLHPSSTQKNPISGECGLQEPGKPRGKSSLIRPNQSLVFTAYGRGGGGGVLVAAAHMAWKDRLVLYAEGCGLEYEQYYLEKRNLFVTCVFFFFFNFFLFFGLARGAAVVQYVPRFRQRISAKLPSLRVAAANKWRECLRLTRFTELLLSNYLFL